MGIQLTFIFDLVSWDFIQLPYSSKRFFFIGFQGFSTIVSFENADSFVSFFPICLLFISFPCIIAFDRTPTTKFNE